MPRNVSKAAPENPHVNPFDDPITSIDAPSPTILYINDKVEKMALPEPAEVVFLSQLDGFGLEKKARFLGCVKHYDAQSNNLYLAHEYPQLSYQIVACVNLDHVIEAIHGVDFQAGAWLNVTGYTCGRRIKPQYSFNIDGPSTYSEVSVRAVMIWNATSLDLPAYEQALESRKDALRQSHPSQLR